MAALNKYCNNARTRPTEKLFGAARVSVPPPPCAYAMRQSASKSSSEAGRRSALHLLLPRRSKAEDELILEVFKYYDS